MTESPDREFCRVWVEGLRFARLIRGSVLAGLFLTLAGFRVAQAGLIKDSGAVEGGLVVVVGSERRDVVGDFGSDPRFLVQVLDTDPSEIEKIRNFLFDRGMYGRVSADVFGGESLPYADNLVNVIVVADPGSRLSPGTLERVLAPGGVAVAAQGASCLPQAVSPLGDNLSLYRKPIPEDIDEWTHYLYDSRNNAVSHDKIVGSPKRLQWDSGPRWSRNHDHMSSVSAVVSSGGRIFSILDEGPRSSIQLPPDWKLVARDAFSGKLLWKRSIPEWHSDIWPAKSGPARLPRRLVAIGDRVFVTLGLYAPVSLLDAATGKTLKVFENTRNTEEILVEGNELFVVAHPGKIPDSLDWKLETVRCWTEKRRANRAEPWVSFSHAPKRIAVVNIASGEQLWSRTCPVSKISLGVDEEHVLYHSDRTVICLDRESGETLWESEYESKAAGLVKEAPNLVIYVDVVLFSKGGAGQIAAISIRDGRTLWIGSHGHSGHQSTYDLMVADGLVWSPSGGRAPTTGDPKADNEARKLARSRRWTLIGREPKTGRVSRVFPPGKSNWFHHRCHRSRATDNYLMISRTGIEYVDVKTGKWDPNPWVRGACLYGYLPANGLTYAPPHPCACYIESKLNGFNALAAGPPAERAISAPSPRLEKGPAYVDVPSTSGMRGSLPAPGDSWPTYRGDNMRSGSCGAQVSSGLGRAWSTDIGGRLSALTIAADTVFVAAVDRHTLYALNAGDGRERWSYTAGGRIDSPPTIFTAGGNGSAEALCVFGCRDGYVYCLRAADGRMAWRFRAVAEERRIVSFDQVESAWPVNGSVLVQDGSVYCVAGRSMFLDGGLHLLKLDALTGQLQFEEVMDDTIPEGVSASIMEDADGAPLEKAAASLDMPVALPDILSSDGQRLYMRSQSIGLDGKRTEAVATRAWDQGGREAHLVCSAGFLDDSWFHRAYWVFGRGYGTGHNGWFRSGRFAPAGRILSFDRDTVFAYGRKPNMYVWSSTLEYQLYSAGRDITPEAIQRVREANRKQEGKSKDGGHGHGITFDRDLYGEYPLEEISANTFNWRRRSPSLLVRAMVLAGETLFVAGPPDVVDEEEIFSKPFDLKVRSSSEAQASAIKGASGALLQAVAAENGKQLNELRLDSCPVFDGMAAAGNSLFMATLDGKVICMEPSGE